MNTKKEWRKQIGFTYQYISSIQKPVAVLGSRNHSILKGYGGFRIQNLFQQTIIRIIVGKSNTSRMDLNNPSFLVVNKVNLSAVRVCDKMNAIVALAIFKCYFINPSTTMP